MTVADLNQSPSRPWWRQAAFVIACAAVIFAGRWRLYAEPLHDDMCTFALFGHEMLAGRPMYTDLWDRKPPLLYFTFAGAEWITGYGRGEILLVNVAAACVTLCGVYAVGRRFGRGAGYFAAALWTLCCADLDLIANQPDPEAFINACVTAAVALMLWAPALSRSRRLILFIGIGVLLSAATLYKHNAAMVCGPLLLVHCFLPIGTDKARSTFARRGESGPSEHHRHRLGGVLRRLEESVVAESVIVVAWLIFLGHAYVAGRLPATVDVLFRQNLAYSGGSVGHNLLLGLRPNRLFPPFMGWAIGPGVLIIVFAAVSIARRKRWTEAMARGWIVCGAWAVGAWMTIVFTGHVYPHYYVMWLPVGCICGGWAAASLWSDVPRWGRAVVVIVLLGIAVRQFGQFTLSPQQWARRQFPYYDVAAQNALGMQLGQLLRPDESFYELGEDNSLYFLSRHSPPTGLLFIDPLIYGSDISPSWKRLMSDLDRKPVDLVILSSEWTFFFPPSSPIFPWLRANYDPYPTPIGRPTYRMFVRRGGKLEKRLNGESGE